MSNENEKETLNSAEPQASIQQEGVLQKMLRHEAEGTPVDWKRAAQMINDGAGAEIMQLQAELIKLGQLNSELTDDLTAAKKAKRGAARG